MTTELFTIAKRYHDTCDYYDELVCSGYRDGEPWPVTPKEYKQVNGHAKSVRNSLIRQNREYTSETIDKAIRRYNDW